MLNIHLESVERLHQNRIYPIVLLIKFKSVKQIREVKVSFNTLLNETSNFDPKLFLLPL